MNYYKANIVYAYPDCYPRWLSGILKYPDATYQGSTDICNLRSYFYETCHCEINISTQYSSSIWWSYPQDNLGIFGINNVGWIIVGNNRYRVATIHNLNKFIKRVSQIEEATDKLLTFNGLHLYKKYLIEYNTSSSMRYFIVDSLDELILLNTTYPMGK